MAATHLRSLDSCFLSILSSSPHQLVQDSRLCTLAQRPGGCHMATNVARAGCYCALLAVQPKSIQLICHVRVAEPEALSGCGEASNFVCISPSPS
jgi:hypothetical protein